MEAYFTRYIKQSDDKQKEENTFAKRLTMVGLKQRLGGSGMPYYMLYQAYSPDSMNFEHINMELKRAAIFRDMDLFKFLMHTQPRLGYRYNYRGHHWTLLQLAVYLGHDEFLIPLLRSGINVHSRDKSGKTALHLAAEKENVEACRILVDFGANIEEGGSNSSPFKLAMESKNPQLIQLFVNLRYRPMVPVWLLKNAKLTSKQIESLIASLDTTSRLGLLTHSISQHRSNLVKKLVEMNPSFVGMKMNAKTSLLHLAAHLNNVDAARILLDAGARIDAKDSLGSRPLHIAAMHGYLDAARLLVDSGANMRTTDSRRRTPVMVAHSNDHYEVERYLRVEGNKFGKFLSCIR
jgi:ankyrin repeat protein